MIKRSGAAARERSSCLPYCSYIVIGLVCFVYGAFVGTYFIHDNVVKEKLAPGPALIEAPLETPFLRSDSPIHQTLGIQPQGRANQPARDPPLQLPSEPPLQKDDASTEGTDPSEEGVDIISSFEVKKERLDGPKAVLIVGGTDGSGTRRVVQVLSDLGVVMVSEDPETYDIHADLVRGWPEIVRPVISESKSLNYDPSNLSARTRRSISSSLRKLLAQAEQDSHKSESHKLAVGGALTIRTHARASRIAYGFKAPVAMTLSPCWAAELPNFRFVHVVRDGRDIAFSANQGPVEKFYANMYGSSLPKVPSVARGQQRPLQAMQLWSDWNAQLFHWAQRYTESLDQAALTDGSNENATKSFGYLMIHTEDLVSPDLQTRLAAIVRMAHFVGSSLTRPELCCLAMRDAEFMGSHDRDARARAQASPHGAASALAARFGKWRRNTASNPQLLTDLYTLGSEGLRVFGYDPMRKKSAVDIQCDQVSVESCKTDAEKQQEQQLQAYLPPGECSGRVGMDYKGGDLQDLPMPAGDPGFCCRACKARADCRFFTAAVDASICYLKSSQGSVLPGDRLVSGSPL